jgi:hypothetical protein
MQDDLLGNNRTGQKLKNRVPRARFGEDYGHYKNRECEGVRREIYFVFSYERLDEND